MPARPSEAPWRHRVPEVWGCAVLVAALVSAFAPAAFAQCASCGNPAFVSGGNDMSRQLVGHETGYRLRSTLAYGYTTSDTYYEGRHDVGSLDAFRADLHIFSLATVVDAPFGGAVEVVLPYGYLASERNFAGSTVDQGLGDLEFRLRQEVLQPLGLAGGAAPRVQLSFGFAAPTGVYVERESTDDVSQFVDNTPTWGGDGGWEDIDITLGGDSSRYLSIGRGVWWALADLEVLGSIGTRLGYYGAVQARFPLQFAPDGFEWGNEVRNTLGLNVVALPGVVNAGVTAELLWRGRSTEELYGQRQDFANGGGLFGYLTPTVQALLGQVATVGVSLRVPIYRDVVGTQVVDNMGVWVTVGGRFGLGGAAAGAGAAAAAAVRPRSTQPGEPPLREEVRRLLVPGKVTVVDYWASWCKPCQALDVHVQAYLAERPDGVVFVRFDATEWGKDEWLRYLPDAPTLPVLEVYSPEGTLVRRLSGDETSRFREFVPKPPAAPAVSEAGGASTTAGGHGDHGGN
ncbi:MAG: hypothetical protein RIT45_2934 [Pseudomonadota bacterium]